MACRHVLRALSRGVKARIGLDQKRILGCESYFSSALHSLPAQISDAEQVHTFQKRSPLSDDLVGRGMFWANAGVVRSFAAKSKPKSNKKNKRDNADDDDDESGTAFDISVVYSGMKERMGAAVEALGRELGKLRTGRASPGMLDHVNVPVGTGGFIPLSNIAAITVRDAQTLAVTLYDQSPSTVKSVQKAISDSPLGLNPIAAGSTFNVPIPGLTNEVKAAMLKLMGKAENSAKESVRRARHDSLQAIKKGLPKADLPKKQKEVDEVTKKYTKQIEDACSEKEKQITSGT